MSTWKPIICWLTAVLIACAGTTAFAADTGRLALDVSPEPANVFIDGKKYSNGSGVFKLESGDHKVEIRKKGYETASLDVFIGPDALVTKDIVLKRIPTKAEIEAENARRKREEARRKAEIEAENARRREEEARRAAERNNRRYLEKTAAGEFAKTPMVRVPAGWFVMGSDNGDGDEKYAHEVYADDFHIEKYEVSAAQFAAFLNAVGNSETVKKYADVNCDSCTLMHGDAPETYYKEVKGKKVALKRTVQKYFARKGYEDRPANNVSWYGARAYCRWIHRRLPTEAEWEKAARGTDARKYPWGNNAPGKNHNLAVYDYRGHDDKWTDMKSVTSLHAGQSPYGAHHMAGNVWEWVADWYDKTYYQNGVVENPQGPPSGTSRVLRGGSWSFSSSYIPSAYRDGSSPDYRHDYDGCRCAQ